MRINTDINILGGLSDWSLIETFLTEDMQSIQSKGGTRNFSSIRTDRSVARFEKAIRMTLLTFQNTEIGSIFRSMLGNKGSSADTLLFLFWNASYNNDLLHYINKMVYFPAYYSGRVAIRREEVEACIIDLKATEDALKKWSAETIQTTASKYLTLLKKFGLMEGTSKKTIIHHFLSDEMFILYLYWLRAVSEQSNLLKSEWMRYSMNELQPFLDRIMQKQFTKYFNVTYTGDKLQIETKISYDLIYDYINKP